MTENQIATLLEFMDKDRIPTRFVSTYMEEAAKRNFIRANNRRIAEEERRRSRNEEAEHYWNIGKAMV